MCFIDDIDSMVDMRVASLHIHELPGCGINLSSGGSANQYHSRNIHVDEHHPKIVTFVTIRHSIIHAAT